MRRNGLTRNGAQRNQKYSGAAGPTGLDYGIVFRLLDNRQMQQSEWDDWLDDIRVMENEALAALSERTASTEPGKP